MWIRWWPYVASSLTLRGLQVFGRPGIGDRFTIYQKSGPISHPVSNMILGYKVIPLGTLQVAELEENVSKAIITTSFMEIAPGAERP